MKKGCIWAIIVYLIFNTIFVAGMSIFDGPANYVVTAENGTNIYSFKNENTGTVLKKLPHKAVIEVEEIVSPWAVVKLDGKKAYIREETLARESTMWLKYDAPLGNEPIYAKIFLALVSLLSIVGALTAYSGRTVSILIPLTVSIVIWGYTLFVDSPFMLVLDVLPMPDESYLWAFIAAVLFIGVALMSFYTLLRSEKVQSGTLFRWLYLTFVWSAMLIMAGYMLFFAYVALRVLITIIIVVAVFVLVGKGLSSQQGSSASSNGSMTPPDCCGCDCIHNTGIGFGYCDLGERHKCHINFISSTNCGHFKWNGKTIGGFQK